MYSMYREVNRGHELCPLYRGCPLFGGSVIRGFTVPPLSTCTVITVCIYVGHACKHHPYTWQCAYKAD